MMRVAQPIRGFFAFGSGAVLLLIAACADDEQVEGFGALERHVARSQVGSDHDQWIEMRNMAGEWERTGLIFGSFGDAEVCQQAIDRLQKVNYAREYRCTPAN